MAWFIAQSGPRIWCSISKIECITTFFAQISGQKDTGQESQPDSQAKKTVRIHDCKTHGTNVMCEVLAHNIGKKTGTRRSVCKLCTPSVMCSHGSRRSDCELCSPGVNARRNKRTRDKKERETFYGKGCWSLLSTNIKTTSHPASSLCTAVAAWSLRAYSTASRQQKYQGALFQEGRRTRRR